MAFTTTSRSLPRQTFAGTKTISNYRKNYYLGQQDTLTGTRVSCPSLWNIQLRNLFSDSVNILGRARNITRRMKTFSSSGGMIYSKRLSSMSTQGVQPGFLRTPHQLIIQTRQLGCSGDTAELLGLVIGVFTRDDDPYGTTKILTKYAEEYDMSVDKRVSDILDSTGPIPKLGQHKVLFKLDPFHTAVVVVGLGNECATYNDQEEIDEMKENVRNAVAIGVQVLQGMKMKTIFVEGMGSTEAAAEGAALGVWRYQELKNPNKQINIPRIELKGDCNYTAWQIGLQKAAAQNIARQLCETPANILTPLGFAQAAVEILCKNRVSVEVKVREWAEIMKMSGFLAAARGSCQPPIFLEMSYYGCDPDIQPVVMIGKAVTFDSGGICLKRGEEMALMRGDMAGAAAIVGAIRAAAALRLPINIRGLLPIYENLPGSCAMKPGDTIRVRSGKSVLIHDTDYDGRLSLADALSYSQIFNPKCIIDVGTFSKELLDSLGEGACGVFSNNDALFETLRSSAVHTGDRVWRLPLWGHYSLKVRNHSSADVQDREILTGIPCTCAAFLREFLPPIDWIHLDTYNIMLSDGKVSHYLRRGMSGRPTRTIVEFLAQMACKGEDQEEEAGKVKAKVKG